MKQLTILLLASLPFMGWGQVFLKDTTIADSAWVATHQKELSMFTTAVRLTTALSKQLKYDTVPMIMWVSDTSIDAKGDVLINGLCSPGMKLTLRNGTSYLISGIWQIRGYEVLIHVPDTIPAHYEYRQWQNSGVYYDVFIETRVTYHLAHYDWLDADKHPLKLFLGLSFPINKQ